MLQCVIPCCPATIFCHGLKLMTGQDTKDTDPSNFGVSTVAMPVYELPEKPCSAQASTSTSLVSSSRHMASTVVFIAYMSLCVPWILRLSFLWRPYFVATILVVNFTQRLLVCVSRHITTTCKPSCISSIFALNSSQMSYVLVLFYFILCYSSDTSFFIGPIVLLSMILILHYDYSLLGCNIMVWLMITNISAGYPEDGDVFLKNCDNRWPYSMTYPRRLSEGPQISHEVPWFLSMIYANHHTVHTL